MNDKHHAATWSSNRWSGSTAGTRAAILVLLLVGTLAAATFAAPPLAPEEVRERRWTKEEQPLWREALALPQTALGVITWPLKHALFWAERVDLPGRLADFVLYPAHQLAPQERRPQEERPQEERG